MRIPGYRRHAAWRGLIGLFFLAGLVLATPGMALDPERRVSQLSQDSWRSDDGLPQNSLLSLAQTRDGYVWLGTWEGLVRFDGARFVVFDKRNTPELRNHTIKALAEDPTGTLWVGTEQGLVAYHDGRFERAPGAAAPLDGVKVEELLVGEGVLWVGTSVGLWQVPLGDGAARQYTVEQGLPASYVTALTQGEGGSLWVGTKHGLARVVGGEVEASTFAIPGPKPRQEILALSRDSAGVLWVGTIFGLVSWNGTVAQRYTPEDGLPASFITALYTDSHGTLWVGTRRGGLVRHTAEGFSAPVPGTGLVEAEVLSLLEDRDGHLWVGTYSGLFRLRDGPFSTYGMAEGLDMEGTVSAVLEDRHGTQWIGTVGAGLYRLENGLFRHVGAEEGLTEKVIPALHEAADGTLWVGTLSGLYRYDGKRFTKVPREQGGPQEVVTAVLQDSQGDLWVGTQSSLLRIHDGNASSYGPKQGFTHPVIVITEDVEGRVWFGSETGLLRWEGEKKGFRRYTQKDGLPGDLVLSLLADEDGTLWVGTETGLGRWRDEKWERFTVQQGLYDDAVFSLVPDADGHLWMSSNKGVSRVSRRELEEVADKKRARVSSLDFDQRDGMRSAECNGNTQPSGWRAKDGRLWFANLSGAIVVDPVRVHASRQPPEVRIEEVRVQGRTVPVEGRVEMPPGGSRLEIRFTAFSPVDAARLPFRYRLRGHDDGWVNAEVRMATYTGLRPGSYRFEVQAAGRDGAWSEPVALDVVLEPKLWQRTGFWLMCVLGTVLLGVSVYLLRVGQLKARERWLAERVQDRTRALARANEELEAHMRTLRQTQAQLVQAGRMAAVGQLAAGVGHEINNPLAYIVSNLEHASEEADALARELGEMRGAGPRLREVSQALREALHGADRVRRIVRDLKTFSRPDDEKQGPVELHAVLDSAVKIAMAELRPRAKLVKDYGDVPRVEANEARLAQVFLNLLINAAQALPEGKAEENEVRLSTKLAPNGMVIAEVRDTGIGIAPEALGRIFDPFYTTKPPGVGTGLGLSLCHAYVSAMGGTISVESEPGKGTVFRVTLRRALPESMAAQAPRAARESGAMPALQLPRAARESGSMPAVQLPRAARESGSMPAVQPSREARESSAMPVAQTQGAAAESRPSEQVSGTAVESKLAAQTQGAVVESKPSAQVLGSTMESTYASAMQSAARESLQTPGRQESSPAHESQSVPATQGWTSTRESRSMPAVQDSGISRESRSMPAVQDSGASRASPSMNGADTHTSGNAAPSSTDAHATAARPAEEVSPSARALHGAARAQEPDPLASAREPRTDVPLPDSLSSTAALGESAEPERGRVLVVDDDALVSGAIRRTLSRENDVEVLVSAKQALAQLTAPELRYDVILCDLMMPEMTGMDLFDALKRQAPRVAERVVFITGGAFTPSARTFLDQVENPRVEKPFDPEALRKLIRTEVARVRREASERAA
ncbi:response regulator [Pyxidicoccus parkwayensis]|uniref:histidine kinase n=1 Tax=Pyxidicoccus parkwayensis TaxID=2813578 RepID=A0ABX7NWH4_9BACT|nr:two-component regulator propeller domain-containing protein [Pyxidicoccus parkwaysis]QSQ21817.1 response regulator [Pyxidicoccus parkwaysis]